MDKTTFTYTCRVCGKQNKVKCIGILMPLAEPLAAIQSFAHILKTHRRDVGWNIWFKSLFRLFGKCVKLVLLTVLVALRAVMYVFYPVYLLLGLIYET